MRTDLGHLINTTAGRIHRRYRVWAEYEDIKQEMWMWACAQNERKLTLLSTTTIRRRLWDVGVKYARREKATRSGYDTDDEVFYSVTLLRELLPLALDQDGPVLRGVDDRDGKLARRTAAGPGMELEAALADVRKAYSRLAGHLQLALASYVAGDGTGPLVDSGLMRMQRILGGRRPRGEAA